MITKNAWGLKRIAGGGGGSEEDSRTDENTVEACNRSLRIDYLESG
jgi:hypothetical protein